MATSAAKEMRYSYGTVSGSLAHSLDREVLEHDLRHAGELTWPREESREKPKVHSLERVRVRERQHVSLVTVAGFAAVIALALMVLMNYVQLTVISSDVVALQSELATLKTENVTLTAQHEQMFDLDTVKEAAEAAGMTKPSSSQQDDPGFLSKLLTSLHHGVYAVVEYFN